MASMKSKKANYSTTEIKILDLLPKGGRLISSKELADKLYEGRKDRPFNERQSIVATMTTLIRKVEYNSENFRILKSDRSGPNPMKYKRVKEPPC